MHLAIKIAFSSKESETRKLLKFSKIHFSENSNYLSRNVCSGLIIKVRGFKAVANEFDMFPLLLCSPITIKSRFRYMGVSMNMFY